MSKINAENSTFTREESSLTPRQFYEDVYGEVLSHGTMSYGQSTQITVYAKIAKSSLSQEDLILLTVIEAARMGGVMEQDAYNGFINSFVFNSPSVTWSTTLGDSFETLDRMQGKNTPQRVFDDLKRDVLPIHEARDIAYNRIVSALMRSTNTDPDLVYLMELCKKLPRVSGHGQVNPF